MNGSSEEQALSVTNNQRHNQLFLNIGRKVGVKVTRPEKGKIMKKGSWCEKQKEIPIFSG
jgi:hypothetical protein